MAAKTATRSPRRPRRRADLSPEVLYYLRSRGYQVPTTVPYLRTPEPRDVPGAVFDPARVDRVVNALKHLRHTQGKWAGKPLAPDAWQVAYVLAPVFGWLHPDEDEPTTLVRIIREAYIEVSRKNGKTTIASGLALYLAFADGEHGAQVIAVAGSEKQARNCFDPAATLTRHSPALKKAGVRALRSRIVQQATGSFFEVASSVGDLLHGSNVHGAIIDELHVHKSPDVVDAVESGTGARAQPLVVTITTADEGKTDSVYAHKRKYIEKLARRTMANPSTYGVIFAADPEDGAGNRPFLESTWKKANPGYGVSPTRAFMRSEAAKARQNPANRSRFLRLHLGLRVKQEKKWLELGPWDRNAGKVDVAALAGRSCFGGLDLASVSDLTALVLVFPDDEGGYDVVCRFWTPEANLRALDERTAGAATTWMRQGYLIVTPGEVTDYEYVKAQVREDLVEFEVGEIAYDPWNSTQIVTDLLKEDAPLVEMRQGYASMSPPLKELLRLVLTGTAKKPRVRHGGNPVLRWMVDNLAVAMDPAGNVKPDRKHSGDKIDGVVALVMGLDRAQHRAEEFVSAYEDDDLMIV